MRRRHDKTPAQPAQPAAETPETPQACTACGTPVHLTEDWTLWPWPDGAQLCSGCNDARHAREEYPGEASEECAPDCASRVPFGECTCGRVDRQAAEDHDDETTK